MLLQPMADSDRIRRSYSGDTVDDSESPQPLPQGQGRDPFPRFEPETSAPQVVSQEDQNTTFSQPGHPYSVGTPFQSGAGHQTPKEGYRKRRKERRRACSACRERRVKVADSVYCTNSYPIPTNLIYNRSVHKLSQHAVSAPTGVLIANIRRYGLGLCQPGQRKRLPIPSTISRAHSPWRRAQDATHSGLRRYR